MGPVATTTSHPVGASVSSSGPLRHRAARTQARLLGLAVAGAGVVNLVSALTPSLRDRLALVRAVFTPAVTHLAAGATALLGVALLLLGRGIVRHRRASYIGAVIVLVLSAFTEVFKGFDYEESLVALGVAVLLLRSGQLFGAPMPRARWRTLLWATPTAVVVGVGYGLVGFAVRHQAVRPRFTVGLALRETAARLVGLTGPLHVQGRFATWFPASITVLGFVAVVVLAAVALAPIAERTLGTRAERERVRALVERRTGGDTLDPFALREDKQYVFSADGRAAIAYRYVAGVGVSAGDPVGEPSSYGDALARFLDHCDRHGWRPACVGAREDRLSLYEHAGLRTMYLGEEAVIDVDTFTLDGRRMRPVRQAVNRTKNFGISTVILRERGLEPTLRRALVGISERARGKAPERGFSMALDGLLSGRNGECVIVVARDEAGAPFAFQRYVPCRAGTGLSLDAMRRDQGGPNGVNERMIADVVAWGRSSGIHAVSLNFAAFKGLIEEDAALTAAQSAEAWLVRRLNPYFQIESLLVFNAKFHPRWVARYLVYRSPGDLPAVIFAALSAESFLPFDRGPRAVDDAHEADLATSA